MNALILGAALLFTLLLGTFPYLKPVTWADEVGDRSYWRRLALIITPPSLGLVLACGLALQDVTALRLAATTFVLGASTVLLAYSLVTDLKVRQVDRRPVQVSIVVTGLLSTTLLIQEQAWITASAVVSLTVLAALLYLFAINSIGAGDVRALFLVALGLLPVMGWIGFVWGSLFAGLYFLLIGLTVAFLKRTTKASFPAVPMLIFPYWAVVAAGCFITFKPLFSSITV